MGKLPNPELERSRERKEDYTAGLRERKEESRRCQGEECSQTPLRISIERIYPLRAWAAFAILSSASLVPSSRRDRKSTRLNSSHSQISYAVFCLKKNKIY